MTQRIPEPIPDRLTERPRSDVGVQFDSARTQDHAVRLGMWVFLGSETLLFAGLFGLYAAYRTAHAGAFHAASAHNDAITGTVMTALLICSSFSVAWALHALRGGKRRVALASLAVTIALGLTFLGLKAHEYSHHLASGIYPGVRYHYAALPSHGAALFFTLYYFMTGLHALHVTAGLVFLIWVAARVVRRRITADRHTALEMGGLYWHLVDIVWIFLWPLLYLGG